jgi:hypothetical protein
MNNFLFKLVKKFVALIFIYIFIVFMFHLVLWNLNLHKNTNVNKNTKLVILGNSHTSNAIKNSEFILNYSRGGETVFYNVIKAQYLIKRYPKLEFSFEFYDQSLYSAYINFANHRISDNLRKYLYLMNSSQLNLIFKKNPEKVLKVLLTPWLNDWNIELPGGYKNKFDNKKVNISKSKTILMPLDYIKFPEEDELINFKVLFDFVKNNPQTKFYITRMPQSRYLKHFNKPIYIACLNDFLKLPNLKIIDLSNIDLSDDKFEDHSHLNGEGQRIISDIFIKKWYSISKSTYSK